MVDFRAHLVPHPINSLPLVLVLLCILCLPLVAADFSYKGHISSSKITLTEDLTLELALTFPPSYHLNVAIMRERLMQFGMPGVAPFRLAGEKIGSPQKGAEGSLHQTLSFTLEPQIPGNYRLTFLAIPFEPDPGTSGKLVELLSEIYPVQVLEASEPALPTRLLIAPLLTLSPQPSIEPSPANRLAMLNPDRVQEEQQRNVRKQEERHIPWLGLIALAGAFALLVTSKKKRAYPELEVHIDPRQAALKHLEVLQQQRPNAEEFYSALTMTVREYLERVYHVKAQTKTTEEFLREMAVHPLFDEETRRSLVSFLQIADEVKFGLYQPTDAEREAAIAAARKLFK